MSFSKLSDGLQSVLETLTENRTAAAVVGVAAGVVLISGVYFVFRSSSKSARAKDGAADRKKLRQAFIDFSHTSGGVGSSGKGTGGFPGTYFKIAADFYELGWGESFHFTVPLPGKSDRASEAVYESRIATLCNLRPGMKCLDCGCGIGGPMRTIAAISGAEITGITNIPRQVERTRVHNRRYAMESLCKVLLGNFLKIDFPDGAFDAAYAIEAMCFAPDVAKAYREIFRVIKPGSVFVSYDLVTTPLFDPKNPVHVKAIDDIAYSSGLPDLRSAAACIAAAKSVGFEHVKDFDVALESKVCKPWYARLEKAAGSVGIVHKVFVNLLTFLRLLSAETKEVHDMLLEISTPAILLAAREGFFTPMHLFVFRKPLTP